MRSTRGAQALAPLLADDQAASSQFPGTARSSIVRAPARSTACPRSGAHNPPDGCPLLRAPPPGAARSRAPTRPLLHDGVWIHVHSRLVADRAPIGCWGASAWRPTPPRAPGLEAPADLAGRAHPGAGPGTGPQNRVGIEGALLGTGASACGHAPRLLAPVAPVGARVALDPAPDHRRGPAEHSGDARLTTQTPAPHRSQHGPPYSKTDDNPHPTPLNQETGSHSMTPPRSVVR